MVDFNSELNAGALSLPLPTFLPLRYQPGSLANWSGHLAFANDLIAQHRPSILVELGTHHGESYFGMCQSVLGNGIDCVCYAVDHWLGEEHAGRYGEEVFNEVNEYNQRLYKSFSYLLRSSFDDARDQFSDNSIDLLHIDGLHTYEAGLHDFQYWFPKVKPGGIVLLHDVMVRHANFGIWKVWEELQARYHDNFAFNHSWGLGVLRKPGLSSRHANILDLLFSSDDVTREQVRRHYVLYAAYVDRLAVKAAPRQTASQPVAAGNPNSSHALFQVFVPELGLYSESASLSQDLPFEIWTTLDFDLPSGIAGSIRIDPADQPCILEIRTIELHASNPDSIIWAADSTPALNALQVSSTAVLLPKLESCHVMSYGADPQIFLPDIRHEGHVRLVITVRISSGFEPLAKALAQTTQLAALDANKVLVQIYPSNEGGYKEETSVTAYTEMGVWNTVSFNLQPGSLTGPMRVDPADTSCLVEIAELQILDSTTSRLLQSFQGVTELSQLIPLDSAMHLPATDRCLIFCFGDDPRLEFTPTVDFTGAVTIRISLKIARRMEGVADLLRTRIGHSSAESKLSADIETLKVELRTSQSCRLLLAAELSQFATEKNSILREKDDAIVLANSRAAKSEELLAAANERIAPLEQALAEESRKTASALQSFAQAMGTIQSVEQSLSWRLTKPLRSVMRVIRGGASS